MIDEINAYSTTIASAVEEQTVATNEIGRSVSEGGRHRADQRQHPLRAVSGP